MLIRTMADLEAAGRVISISHGRARAVRLLTKSDGLAFSVSEARSNAVGASELWYKNHWEANYIRSGEATLEDRSTGERWALTPGVLYCVGPNDRHRIIRERESDMRIISVFNPPIEGKETHDEDGAYPPTGAIPEGPPKMFVRTVEDVQRMGRESVVAGGAATTRRYLLADDRLGFSFSAVFLDAGASADLWYKHHWEANVVLDGTAAITDRESGETHTLGPGAMYVVGPQDRHHVRAVTDLHIVSVFDPPLAGGEQHDQDGSFPPTGPVPAGPSGA